MPKKIILFVCSGNTCRSPMAEGIMHAKLAEYCLDDEYEAASAGLCVLEPSGANAKSLAVCAENGIDISPHRARQIDREMITASSLILTMTQAHKFDLMENTFSGSAKLFTLKEYAAKFSLDEDILYPDITDPFGGDYTVYQKTFKTIETYIDIIIQNLIIKREGI